MVANQVTISEMINTIASLPRMTIEAVEASVNFYGKKILKRHFEWGNQTSYNYPNLSPEYAVRKLKRYGNKPMMVASGKAKRQILVSAKAKKLSPKQINLVIRAPAYMMHHLTGSGPLPKRNWLYPNKRDVKDILRFARMHLKKSRSIRRR